MSGDEPVGRALVVGEEVGGLGVGLAVGLTAGLVVAVAASSVAVGAVVLVGRRVSVRLGRLVVGAGLLVMDGLILGAGAPSATANATLPTTSSKGMAA